MTIASSQWISEQKAFAGLSAEGQRRLEQEAQLLRYRLGQPLSIVATVPSQVLVILQGTARLTAPDGAHWRTIERLGPGDVWAWPPWSAPTRARR